MARHVLVLSVLALLVAGSTLAAALPALPGLGGAPGADPAVMGAWEAPFEGRTPAVSMALLEDGRVVYWGGIEAGLNDNVFFTGKPEWAETRILSPPYTQESVSRPADYEIPVDLFCAGLTILPDGRILTAGGSEWRSLGEEGTAFVDGLATSQTFDLHENKWVASDDMDVRRWYPTVMTLADGSALAASGVQHLPQPQTHNTLLETWTDGEWAPLEGADQLLPMYPRLFTVPGGPMKGDLFYETVGTMWGPFGEHPAEALWSLEQAYDPEAGTWSFLGPSVGGARQHAATVMLPLEPEDAYAPKLLTFGGALGRTPVATSLTEITDLAGDHPRHTVTDSLAHPRWHLNGVLLPDGTVLAVGGGLYDTVYAHGQPNVPVLPAEQYDPLTGEWHERAAMTVPRMYHSTALLLPDGRVLVGGHVPLPVPWTAVRENVPMESQIVETRFEIYNPPYLYWGERPVIDSAPASVAHGAAFTVTSPNADDVVDAILVHPGSTTHAWDSSQRAIVLPVASQDGDALTFVAPPDGDVATPGAWMLFLRTEAEGGQGLIPSVAKFVRVG